MPSRWMCRSAVTWASTPTTASRRSSSTVVAGLVRSAPARKPGGRRAASTLRPTASAVAGDTPVSITWFKCSVSVQNGSFPHVRGRRRDVSRDEAARALRVSRNLAAFHLDKLVAQNLLDTTYRRLTGRRGPGAGRPAKLYRCLDRQLDFTLPPRRYALAGHLLALAITA